MELTQLETFVAVARGGSVRAASERVHLSQPAVSGHIKAVEDALGLTLFERTSKGMTLTAAGRRLLEKAEQTLAAHQGLLDEAARTKGGLRGQLRLGAASNTHPGMLERLLATFAQAFPDVETTLEHRTSAQVVAGLREGELDAGLFHAAGGLAEDLVAHEVGRFTTFVAAAPGMVPPARPLDWPALARLPWVYPAASACCGRTAEDLFRAHQLRPVRVINVDRQLVTRTLLASGAGVGLLHEDVAREAERTGELELLHEVTAPVQVVFAHLATRAADPVLEAAVTQVLRGGPPRPRVTARAPAPRPRRR
ncbi:MAG: LysR family transcriptional regulator [Myxococcaceae bacterium]|nr:LysR family transcriptional regulator [Myxococcaceae bacterium]